MKGMFFIFPKRMTVAIVTVILLKTIMFFVVLSGYVCIDYRGFSIDNEDNLYVGMPSVIKVYSAEGEFLRSFSPKTSRGYSFMVEGGEKVLIDTGNKLFILDLYGNVLNEIEDSYSRIKNSNKFVSNSGNKYVVNNYIFRTSVSLLRDGSKRTIFKMPALDYIIKLLDWISDIVLIVLVVIMIISFRSFNRKQ